MENNAWNEYASEFNSFSIFDSSKIHIGLGLVGAEPGDIVKDAKTILDVGCGEGTNTFLLHSINSNLTVGVDIAATSIKAASKKYSKFGCEFYNEDFYEISKHINNNMFDLITFFGSIDYIQLNKQFFDTLERLTHSRSRCFLSKFHPMWTTLFENDVDKQETKCYFEDGRIDLVSYGVNHQYVLQRYHYSISYIVQMFMDYGWKITFLSEPKPSIEKSSFKYKEILNVYNGKIIVSHCVCKDLIENIHHRTNCISKDAIIELSKRGCIFGIPFINDIVCVASHDTFENDNIIFRDIINQILYFCNLIGSDKVALGPDYMNLLHFSNVFREKLIIPVELMIDKGLTNIGETLVDIGLGTYDVENIMFRNVCELLSGI